MIEVGNDVGRQLPGGDRFRDGLVVDGQVLAQALVRREVVQPVELQVDRRLDEPPLVEVEVVQPLGAGDTVEQEGPSQQPGDAGLEVAPVGQSDVGAVGQHSGLVADLDAGAEVVGERRDGKEGVEPRRHPDRDPGVGGLQFVGDRQLRTALDQGRVPPQRRERAFGAGRLERRPQLRERRREVFGGRRRLDGRGGPLVERPRADGDPRRSAEADPDPVLAGRDLDRGVGPQVEFHLRRQHLDVVLAGIEGGLVAADTLGDDVRVGVPDEHVELVGRFQFRYRHRGGGVDRERELVRVGRRRRHRTAGEQRETGSLDGVGHPQPVRPLDPRERRSQISCHEFDPSSVRRHTA